MVREIITITELMDFLEAEDEYDDNDTDVLFEEEKL